MAHVLSGRAHRRLDIAHKVVHEPRITFIQGDQSNPGDLAHLAELGPYDVIIDDGSHFQPHVLGTFDALYPSLKPGGIYVIEDTETAYAANEGGGPPGCEGTGVSLARSLVDEVNREHIAGAGAVPDGPQREIVAVHAYSNILFFERAGGPDPALNRYSNMAAAKRLGAA